MEGGDVIHDLDLFFHESIDLLCIADLDGRFRRVNPQFEKVLGWSEEEMLTRTMLELIHPEDQEASLHEMDKLGVGLDVIHFENRYRTSRGKWVWFSWTCHPHDDRLYCVARDITARKVLDHKLQLIQDLVQNLEIGIYIIQLPDQEDWGSWRVVASNTAAERITGVPNEKRTGLTVEETFPLFVDQALREALIEIVAVRRPQDLTELVQARQPRSQAPLRVRAIPVLEDSVGVLFGRLDDKLLPEEDWSDYAISFFV